MRSDGMESASVYQHILANKLFFSGLAILGICLSHLIGVDRETSLWHIFYPGFVGVDIFLFYSGYGLCRSWEQNPPRTFYLRRLKRIYPLLLVFTLLLYGIACFVKKEEVTFLDVCCNLTTLNFWGVGGILAEWYLSFILYMYILFPVLYPLVRRCGMWAIGGALTLLFVFLFFHRDGWLYQCAFSRVPIFLLGILCYQRRGMATYLRGMWTFVAALLLMAVLFILHVFQKFELVYMSALCVLLLLAWGFRKVVATRGPLFHLFEAFGKYSLEIYLANMLVLYVMPLLTLPCPTALAYVLGHVVLVPLLIGANRMARRLLDGD